MKIIWTDNYNRDSVADMLVCENIRDEKHGMVMVEALQKLASGSDWYVLVDDDHRLKQGMEDFV